MSKNSPRNNNNCIVGFALSAKSSLNVEDFKKFLANEY